MGGPEEDTRAEARHHQKVQEAAYDATCKQKIAELVSTMCSADGEENEVII